MTKTELIRALKSIPALHKGRGYEWTFGLWTLSAENDCLIIRNNDTNIMRAGMCLIDHVRWSNRLEISWCDDLSCKVDIWRDSMMLSLHGEDTCEDDDKWDPQDEYNAYGPAQNMSEILNEDTQKMSDSQKRPLDAPGCGGGETTRGEAETRRSGRIFRPGRNLE